jgi:hypothetical protein
VRRVLDDRWPSVGNLDLTENQANCGALDNNTGTGYVLPRPR